MQSHLLTAALLLVGCLVGFGCQESASTRHEMESTADFKEVECAVEPAYAYFETENAGRGTKRLFVFDVVGVTFAVQPTEYAKRYKEIDHVYRDSQSGASHFLVLQGGQRYRENIGIISQHCWNRVATFAERFELTFKEGAGDR